jgi:mRNA-degrading endonuclease RelE of RelBE toxin-antitoxin system
MEKLKKYLLRLSKDERERIIKVIEMITFNNCVGLDIKKLKGYSDIYKVRVGANRVIFRKTETDNYILQISRRSDSTYKKF